MSEVIVRLVNQEKIVRVVGAGPAGPPGADSTVPGPVGADGPPGSGGRAGSVTVDASDGTVDLTDETVATFNVQLPDPGDQPAITLVLPPTTASPFDVNIDTFSGAPWSDYTVEFTDGQSDFWTTPQLTYFYGRFVQFGDTTWFGYANDESVIEQKISALESDMSARMIRGSNLGDVYDIGAARNNLALGSLAEVTPTGTPDGTKFLRDDDSWQSVAGTPGPTGATGAAGAAGADATAIYGDPVTVAHGGTGGATQAAARTGLGLGTAATQASTAFDTAGAATAAQAASQPLDSDLTAIAALTTTTYGRALLALADAAAARTALVLGTAAVTDTGTGSGNTILGNDARLTDARTPVNHSATLITSGTVAQARLGTGSAGTGALFLADDQTYKAAGGASPQFGYPSGSYFMVNRQLANTTFAVSAGRIYYTPCFLSTAVTLATIGVRITSAAAAGKIFRLARYAVGVTGLPTTKVIDYGTGAADAVAGVELTTTDTLPTGWFYIAFISDGTPTVRSVSIPMFMIPGSTLSNSIDQNNFSVYETPGGSTLPTPSGVSSFGSTQSNAVTPVGKVA